MLLHASARQCGVDIGIEEVALCQLWCAIITSAPRVWCVVRLPPAKAGRARVIVQNILQVQAIDIRLNLGVAIFEVKVGVAVGDRVTTGIIFRWSEDDSQEVVERAVRCGLVAQHPHWKVNSPGKT